MFGGQKNWWKFRRETKISNGIEDKGFKRNPMIFFHTIIGESGKGQDIKTTARWDRMGGGGEVVEGRDIYIPMTDPCCMTESNTVL